jgi:hypothetical protein
MKPATCLLAALCLVSACEGNSKMRQMSSSELTAKRDQCLHTNPTSPGKVTACENIRKECERRRKEGNYAC